MGVLEIVLSSDAAGPSLLLDSLALPRCWFSSLANIPVSRLSAAPFAAMRDLTCLKAGSNISMAPERMMKMPAM